MRAEVWGVMLQSDVGAASPPVDWSGYQTGGKNRSLPDAGALTLLLLLAVLLLAPALFAGQTVYYRDVVINFMPQTIFVFRSLLEGQFPIWNPLSGGGYPQLAGLQPPFFYPLNSLFFLSAWGWISWGMGLTLFLLVHYWLSGALMYVLCRHWHWARPAALIAAVTFELSGYLVSLSNNYYLLSAAAFFPLAVMLTDRAIDGPDTRSLGLAALAFALPMSCGRPDTTWLSAALLVGHVLWRNWDRAMKPARLFSIARSLFLLALIFLFAVLVNAATLIPVREFIPHSNRVHGVPYPEMTAYSFAPVRTIALGIPDFFGNVERGTDWGGYFIGEPDAGYVPYYLTLYGGIVIYFLALFARSPRFQPGLVPFLWSVCALAFLLALGKWTPLFAAFAHLPGATYIRYPVKFFFLWSWALALLAGLGVETLLKSGGKGGRHRYPHRLWWACLTGWGLLLGGLLLLWLNYDTILAALGSFDYRPWATVPAPSHLNRLMQKWLPALWPQWLRMGLETWGWGMAGLGAVWLVLRRGRPVVVLLVLVVSADLLAHNAHFIYYTGRDLFQTIPPLAQYLQQHAGSPPERLIQPYGDPYRLGNPVEDFHEAARLDYPPAETRYRQSIQQLSYNSALYFGIAKASIYTSLYLNLSPASLLETLFPPQGDSLELGHGDPQLGRYTRVAGAAHIGYLLVPVIVPASGKPVEFSHLRSNPNLDLVWQDPSGLFLYRNRHVLPRAYFVPEALVVRGIQRVAQEVDRQAYHLRHRVVLLEDPALQETLKIRASLPKKWPGEPRVCRIARYENNRVVIENRSPESGFLVLADNHYPGWRVTVDGRERPVLLANGFARGVYVEAGRHRVEFTYWPRSFAIGCLIGLLTLALLLGLVGWDPEMNE